MMKKWFALMVILALMVSGALAKEQSIMLTGEMDALDQHFGVVVMPIDGDYRVRLQSDDQMFTFGANANADDYWLLLEMEDGSKIEPDGGLLQASSYEEYFVLPAAGSKPCKVFLMSTSTEGTETVASCELHG